MDIWTPLRTLYTNTFMMYSFYMLFGLVFVFPRYYQAVGWWC